MILRNLTILSIFSFILFSCEKNIDPFVGQHETKLVINAEIQPNKPIYLFVSTSVGLNEGSEPFRPEDFEKFKASIIVNGQTEAPEEILYFEKEKDDGGGLVWRTRRSFSTEEQQHLELSALLNHVDFNLTASSETQIPKTLQLDSAYFIGLENIAGQDKFFYRVELEVKEDDLNLYQNFHLMATSNGKQLELSHFGENQTSIEHPHHHYGVLIHGEYLYSNLISFLIESDEALDNAEIELRNCSDSYMDYHVSLSRSYASQNSPFNEPTLNYTNITNGLGVFSSFSSSISEINFE